MIIEPKTTKEFYKIFDSSNKLCIDYTASWCGVCKVMVPIFKKIADENPDITFVKVDVDLLKTLPDVPNLSSVPTIKFYKNQIFISEFTGANKNKLEEGIKKLSK